MARILLVADDADIAMLVDLRLSALGHDVVTTHDRVEACGWLLAWDFDLLVCCTMAPNSLSEEFVTQVRAAPGFGEFPIIKSSGAGRTSKSTSVEASFALGKTDSLRTLAEHVERLLCAARPLGCARCAGGSQGCAGVLGSADRHLLTAGAVITWCPSRAT